jgi:outer membrane protein TolC
MCKLGLSVISILCFIVTSIASSPGALKENSGPINLSIDSAIQIGLRNNQEIKSSFSKTKAANGRFWNSISLAQPEVSVSFDDIPENKNLHFYGESVIGVNQSIEFPSKYFTRGSKYSKEIGISEQEFAQVKLDVISRIKSAYYKVLAMQLQMKIAEENLRITDQLLKKAQIRYNVGEGTNLEKLTAKVQNAESLNKVEVQKNHLSNALSELNYTMGYGKSANQQFKLTDSLAYQQLDLELENLFDQALNNNPKLIASKLQVDVSSFDRALALSSYLPDLSVGAYTKSIKDDNNRYYGISLGITVPLWFMFDQNGRVGEASANLTSAKEDLLSNENTNNLQIKCAFNEYKDTERQVVYYRNEIIPQAEEVYRSASRSYESGEITYLEFLEAQKTVLNHAVTMWMHYLNITYQSFL